MQGNFKTEARVLEAAVKVPSEMAGVKQRVQLLESKVERKLNSEEEKKHASLAPSLFDLLQAAYILMTLYFDFMANYCAIAET